MAVRDRIQSQLDTCGTVMLSGTTVTVSFGAAPGCTLANGVQASGSFTMSGAASGSRGGASTAATFTNVTYRAGDCYRNGGSMAITRGPISLTVTFSATTANSGTGSVTQGRRSATATLPAYGSCPR